VGSPWERPRLPEFAVTDSATYSCGQSTVFHLPFSSIPYVKQRDVH
jgi:hypothetical protein